MGARDLTLSMQKEAQKNWRGQKKLTFFTNRQCFNYIILVQSYTHMKRLSKNIWHIDMKREKGDL